MKAKAKITGAVVLLFAITFLPAQGAYADAYDYFRNKVNAATLSITNSSRYQTYVSPIVNRISNNSAVSAFTQGLGSIPGEIRTSLSSGNIALYNRLGSIRSGITSSLSSGGIAFTQGLGSIHRQLTNWSNNVVSKYNYAYNSVYNNTLSRSTGLSLIGNLMGYSRSPTAALTALRSPAALTKTPFSDVSKNTFSSARFDKLTNNLVKR